MLLLKHGFWYAGPAARPGPSVGGALGLQASASRCPYWGPSGIALRLSSPLKNPRTTALGALSTALF